MGLFGLSSFALFVSMRFLTRPLPPRVRALGLSLAAPLMVPMIITVWIALVITGYALVYYAGMNSESFNFSIPGLEPSLGEALYVSGTAISTLGFGAVTPADGLYQTLAVIGGAHRLWHLDARRLYVVGIYGVVQRLGVLGAGHLHQASNTA
jgi:cytochrome b561